MAVDAQWYPPSIGHEFPTSADSALYTPQVDIGVNRFARSFQLDFGPDDRMQDRLCWWLDQICSLHGIPLTPDILKHDGAASSLLVATDGEVSPYEMHEHRWAHFELFHRIRQRIQAIGVYLGLGDACRSDFWRVGEYHPSLSYPGPATTALAAADLVNPELALHKANWMSPWTEADTNTWDTYGKLDRRDWTRQFPGRLYPQMPQFWTYQATKIGTAGSGLTRQRPITTHWVYDTPTWEAFWILQKFCELAVDTIINFNSAPPGAVISIPSGGNGFYVFASWFDPYAYVNSYATGTQYADTLADATAWGVATAAANITGFNSLAPGGPTYLPGSDGTSPNSSTTDTIEAANVPYQTWPEAFASYAATPWVCWPATNEHQKTSTISGGIATGSLVAAAYRSGTTVPSGISDNFLADVENTFMRTVVVQSVGEGVPSELPKKLHSWGHTVQSMFTFSICHVGTATLRQKFGLQTTGAELRSVVTSTLGMGVDGNVLPPADWNLSNLWGTVVTDRYDSTSGTTPLLQPDPTSPNTWFWSQPMRQGGRINTRQNPFNHSIKYTYGWIDYTPDEGTGQIAAGLPDDAISRNGVNSNAICAAIVAAIKAGVDTTVLGTVTPSYGVQTTAFDVEGMLDAAPPAGKGMFFVAVHCDPIEFPSVPSILPTDLANIPVSDPLWHNFLLNHDVTKVKEVTSYIDTSANSGTAEFFTRYDGVPVTPSGVYDPANPGPSTGLTKAAYHAAVQTFTDDWERIALQSYIWGVRATANGYNGTPQTGLFVPLGYWRRTASGMSPEYFFYPSGVSCSTVDPLYNWLTIGHITGLTAQTYGPFPFWHWCNKEITYRQTGNY